MSESLHDLFPDSFVLQLTRTPAPKRDFPKPSKPSVDPEFEALLATYGGSFALLVANTPLPPHAKDAWKKSRAEDDWR
jgi:hypothetical protein